MEACFNSDILPEKRNKKVFSNARVQKVQTNAEKHEHKKNVLIVELALTFYLFKPQYHNAYILPTLLYTFLSDLVERI